MPGIIPGGVASLANTREERFKPVTGIPAVPGIIPGGVAPRPIPVRQLYRGWCHKSFLFIAGQVTDLSCL